jgi:hypothetical protein
MKNGIVGLTKQETGVLEHHKVDPINLGNALTNDTSITVENTFSRPDRNSANYGELPREKYAQKMNKISGRVLQNSVFKKTWI